MSNYKIRFRDQQTGRQVELDAQQVKGSLLESGVEKSFEKSTVGDGQFDMMVSESRWGLQYNRHLGVDNRSMSSEDAQALGRALSDPRSARFSVFDALSGRELSNLEVLKTDSAGELTEVSPNLDTTGTRRPVQITPSGHIATLNGQEPQTTQEVGDGLFRVASMIDDVKGNLFDGIQTTLPVKEKMLAQLIQTLDSVKAGEEPPTGLDGTQGLQMRSSATTTLLELMTSQTRTTNDFKAEAFEVYEQLMQAETNPLLKDSMALNLDRLKETLPTALRERAEGLVAAANVSAPPYDKWFANGDNTVKVDFSNGVGEGFIEDNVKYFEDQGFEQVGGTDTYPILSKTYVKNGIETEIELHFRHDRNSMFDKVDEDGFDIAVYSGHSGWGKNIRNSLKNVEQGSGDGKLIMTNLCVGKGELQQMKDKFPDAQMITTYNSEYFRSGGTAESHYVMNALFEGIAERKGYEAIADRSREVNPWSHSHRREEGIDNNFIFPTDLKTRRSVLDQDHDGQADVFDRMVNFNSFDVKTDTTREFQPIVSTRSADQLVGTKIHFAAQSTNRISVYNEFLHRLNGDAEVVPGGYHEPTDGEAGLFRFERKGDLVEMSMNADYSHMSEEALRMASAFEYSMFKGTESDWPLHNKTDNVLHALVLASQSLNTDVGYRDNAVWSAFLKAYNLPEIPLRTISGVREIDHEHYSGSRQSITELKKKLPKDVLEALGQSKVGVLQ